MENVQHKYHAEVKSQDCLIRINVFADDLQSLFKDLDVIYNYMGYEQSPVPTTSLRGSERRSNLPEKQSATNGNGHTPQPPCPHCGAVGSVELVKWNDKNTGQPRQALKCQACSKWIR